MDSPQPSAAGSAPLSNMEKEVGQIARGAGLGLGGNLVYYFLNFLFAMLVARQIGAQAFGLYTLGVTTVTLLARISVMGLDRGIVRYVSIKRRAGEQGAVGQVILVGLSFGLGASVLVALSLAFFPQFYLHLFRWDDKTDLLTLFPILAWALPAIAMVSISIAGTQAFRTLRYRALVTNTFIPLTKLLVTLALFLVLGYSALTPTLGFTLAQITGGILALMVLFRLARCTLTAFTWGWNGSLVSEILRYSFPLLISSVLVYLNGKTEIMVLGMYHKADASGIYNAALRFATLPLMVLTSFNAIFAPVIADLHHRGDIAELDALFKLVTRWVIMVAMPLLVIMVLFAEPLMGLFGKDFAAGVPVLRLLSISTLVNFSTGSVGIILMMSGYSNLVLANSTLTLIIALVMDFLLIPWLGIRGAAIAGMISVVVVNLVNLGEVWHLIRIQPYNRHTLRPFAASLPALLVGWLWMRGFAVQGLMALVLASLVVGSVYVLTLILMGWAEDDKMMMAALSKRFHRMVGR